MNLQAGYSLRRARAIDWPKIERRARFGDGVSAMPRVVGIHHVAPSVGNFKVVSAATAKQFFALQA